MIGDLLPACWSPLGVLAVGMFALALAFGQGRLLGYRTGYDDGVEDTKLKEATRGH